MSPLHLFRSFAAGAVFAGLAASASAATINYADLQPFNDYDPVPAGYGSTGSAQVSYRSFANDASQTTLSNQLLLWNSGYSSLPAAVFADANGRGAEITLTPIAGYSVTLQSFQLGSYLAGTSGIGPNRTTGILRVVEVGSGSVLWDDTGLVVNSTQTLLPGVTSANGLSVQWGYDWNIGVNNLTFTTALIGGPTVIPVPPAIALFLGGLGLLGWMSRKRS